MIAWCIALVTLAPAARQANAVPPRAVQGRNVLASFAVTWTTSTNGADLSGGYPSALFDGNTDTVGMRDRSRYPVWIVMSFSDFVTLKGFRVWVDSENGEPSNYLVYVDSADSVSGLANTNGHFVKLIFAERTPGGQWMEYAFPCRRAKAFKITFERLDPAKDVVIREIEPIYMTPPTGSAQDVDVTFIERSPKYNFDAAKDRPAPGDIVTYTAHLRNRGTSDLTGVQCAWYYDGALVQTDSVDIPLSSETITYDGSGKSGPLGVTVTYSRAWAEGVHELKFAADTSGAIAETSEENNAVTIMPTGKMVGLCVHESVLHFFDDHQIELGLGSNSWEDWAQRQMLVWSTFMRFNGTRERVYLEKVEIRRDDVYIYGNRPFTEKTFDTQWGFGTSLLDNEFYGTVGNYSETFDREYTLMHEMSHGLSLIDTYATNFSGWTGEVGNWEQLVFVSYGGDYICGTPHLPMISWGGHYEVVPGHMDSDYDRGYCPYHTETMELYFGKRVKYANANQGGSFYGRYTQRIPHNNYLRILDATGRPIAGASVTLYNYYVKRWYEVKEYDDTPEFTKTTGADGRVFVGYNIFQKKDPGTGVVPYDTDGDDLVEWEEVSGYDVNGDGIIDQDDGTSPASLKTMDYRAVILKIEADNQVDFVVFEAQQMNRLAYTGELTEGTYDIPTIIVPGVNPATTGNVALGRSVTASSSGHSSPAVLTNGLKFNFVDNWLNGNPAPSEYWIPTTHTKDQYVRIDLGANYTVYRVDVYPTADPYAPGMRPHIMHQIKLAPTTDFYIRDALLVNERNFGDRRRQGNVPVVYTFRPRTGRYLRLQVKSTQDFDFAHLQEIEVFGVPGEYDSDADGLPDQWENWFLGGLAFGPDDDPDGDGDTNFYELTAGTDPNDPASKFRVSRFELNGSSATIEFNTVTNRQYTIQRRDGALDDAGVSWQDIVDTDFGTGGLISHTLPVDVSKKCVFFRVRVGDWLF